MKKQEIYFDGSLKLASCIFKPDTALTKYLCNIISGMMERFHISDHKNIILRINASRKPTWFGRPESGKFKIHIVRTDRPGTEVIVDDKFYSDEL